MPVCRITRSRYCCGAPVGVAVCSTDRLHDNYAPACHRIPNRGLGSGGCWLAGWEREAVKHQLEGGVVAPRCLLDLVGIRLVLEHDDHRAAGGAGGGDHDIVDGVAVAPRLTPRDVLGRPPCPFALVSRPRPSPPPPP